ncbi:putative plant self-incompatibility S1 [Medicago truncatula]|uniref:S-protein homolog n=1 Tax=Medicago truncatula TaxID=3880 RepID=A0A072VKH5_MEDTR|nr:leguminosin group486 secreted peptide [Medicago truncatula]RHN79456.1 putative plant self-incompatibility S1 [Medicago truncatula]
MSLLTKKLLFLCVLTLLLLHNVIGFGTHHVILTNDLDNNLDLTIHCKSKDDDLGVHLLHHGDTYGFKFRDRIIGNTQFYCSFQWTGEFHHFDVYIQSEDSKICGNTCNWSVKNTVICRTTSYEGYICFQWH